MCCIAKITQSDPKVYIECKKQYEQKGIIVKLFKNMLTINWKKYSAKRLFDTIGQISITENLSTHLTRFYIHKNLTKKDLSLHKINNGTRWIP